MVKCLVLKKTSLVVDEGSIVLVDEKQYELARGVLIPIKDEPKEEKPKKKKQ